MRKPRFSLLLISAALAACTVQTSQPPPPAAGSDAAVQVDAPKKTDAPWDSAAPKGDAPMATPDALEDDGVYPERVAAGTRLKPLYAKTADGAKFFLFAWYDVQLQTRCAFATAEDGKPRCLPLPARGIRYYNDNLCREPLLPAEDGCATAFGLRVRNGRTYVHRMGPPTTYASAYSIYGPPTTPDAVGGVEQCRLDTTVAGQKFFSVGAPVPPEMFVERGPQRPLAQPGKRVVPYVHAATDGMKERAGWWDTKYNQRCFLDTASDGERRCLPYFWLYYPNAYFTDAACTQGVAWSTAAAPPSPYFVRTTSSESCPTRATMYLTELLPTTPPLYKESATGCVPATPPANARFYALKGQVPPTEFSRFTESREGTGRLQRRIFINADGVTDRTSTPIDQQTGELCDFERAPGGRLHCVPRAQRGDVFADATCQNAKRAARLWRSINCAAAATSAALVGGPWCDPVVDVYGLAGPATTHQRTPSGMCEASGLPGHQELGAPAAPGAFAAADVTMD